MFHILRRLLQLSFLCFTKMIICVWHVWGPCVWSLQADPPVACSGQGAFMCLFPSIVRLQSPRKVTHVHLAAMFSKLGVGTWEESGMSKTANDATVMKDCSYTCGEDNKIVQIGLVLRWCPPSCCLVPSPTLPCDSWTGLVPRTGLDSFYQAPPCFSDQVTMNYSAVNLGSGLCNITAVAAGWGLAYCVLWPW